MRAVWERVFGVYVSEALGRRVEGPIGRMAVAASKRWVEKLRRRLRTSMLGRWAGWP